MIKRQEREEKRRRGRERRVGGGEKMWVGGGEERGERGGKRENDMSCCLFYLCRKERVSQLIFPLCTVLDDSIGCAFWFAARGQGTLYNDTGTDVQASSSVYHSQARVNTLNNSYI